MSDFGDLVLVCGDLHVPYRAGGIPEKFQKMLVPNKMQHVLCTGNVLAAKEFETLRGLTPQMHVVAGDFDEDPTLPESKVVQIGHFRIGLIHGHQIVPWGDSAALSIVQRRLGCDILVSGHTHRNDVMEQEGKWFVNPGSMTGAYSHTAFSEGEVVPSFMLLAIKGSKCVTYVYELKNGEVEISKSEFVKKE